jgi:hypothetical protein
MKKIIALIFFLNSAIMLLAQFSKTVNVKAGGLSFELSTEEKRTISKLTITGTIDARDFKTMRDDLPLLSSVDISDATIAEYCGKEGTNKVPNRNIDFSYNYGRDFYSYPDSFDYHANEIPVKAFYYIPQHLAHFTLEIGPGVYRDTLVLYPMGDHLKSYLTSIILPSSITLIGSSAFSNCKELKTVIIPSSVKSIENYAFANCSSLETISIPSSVTNIAYNPFQGCKCLISVDSNNTNYLSIDGVLFTKVKDTLIYCPVTKMGDYDIPSSVISIGENAFYGCSGLTKVTIPTSVKSIEPCAFESCSSLETLTIPSSVINIGFSSFENCSGLKSIFSYTYSPADFDKTKIGFSDILKTCTLYVPYGSKNAYLTTRNWEGFYDIIEFNP